MDDNMTTQSFSSTSQRSFESSDERNTVVDEVEEVQRMAQIENRNVVFWRRVVVLALLSTGIVVTVLTYIFLDREGDEDFKTGFELAAMTIRDNAELRFQGVAEAALGMSEILSSEAEKNGDLWPFVSMASFQVFAQHIQSYSGIESVVLCPFVEPEQLEQWSNFSVGEQGWILEGRIESEGHKASVEDRRHQGKRHQDARQRRGLEDLAVDESRELQQNGGGEETTSEALPTLDEIFNGLGHIAREPPHPSHSVDAPQGDDPYSGDSHVEHEGDSHVVDHDEALQQLVDVGVKLMEATGHVDTIHPYIFSFQEVDGQLMAQDKTADSVGTMAPFWQMSPPPVSNTIVNLDAMSLTEYRTLVEAALATRHTVIGRASRSPIVDSTYRAGEHDEAHAEAHLDSVNTHVGAHELHGSSFANDHPHCTIAVPVFESLLDASSRIVGVVLLVLPWDSYVTDLLSMRVNGIFAVLRNSCGQDFTYQIFGENAVYIDAGDFHDPKYDGMEYIINITENSQIAEGSCHYWFSVYPDAQFRGSYESPVPVVFAVVVASAFVLMTMTFFVFNWFVVQKNDKIVSTAAKSNAIVSSIFPSNVRHRLMEGDVNVASDHALYQRVGGKTRLKKFLTDGVEVAPHREHPLDGSDFAFRTKPIADLFPETTIMFADLVGFTAWSSVREPCSVFTLLETIYFNFDKIAKKRRVFKVETVGDCYVAVCGLPEPRKDHAVTMCWFAHDCMCKMQELTKKLEVALGPDTASLSMRFGLHSGAVTAGVLRGERSRFQLFGDTMNMASRMESTGRAGRIQLSQETANLVMASGKSHWLNQRDEKVYAKGKGEVDTFWLKMHSAPKGSSGSNGRSTSSDGFVPSSTWHDTNVEALSESMTRMIEWQVDVLTKQLHQIQSRRLAKIEAGLPRCQRNTEDYRYLFRNKRTTVLDEVVDIIELPIFNPRVARAERKIAGTHHSINQSVVAELRDLVTCIAAMYRNNPFHNFDHASHVTMSVIKLLSRIVAPADIEITGESVDDKVLAAHASTLHDHTYGITSDPLTQFACVFSALIHDVDHSGVPNTQLVKENQAIAKAYKNKSVAEQNSVDVTWELLMDDNYSNLRKAIWSTPCEMAHFRQIVVNSVMATDIMDKELGAQRKKRWNEAFDESAQGQLSARDNVNRRATIVIEHLIQASDVAHTMQHWHVYRKWNHRLFQEMYMAYKSGRAEQDPSESWYEGEIGFFDLYIIPLAKKLKDCGVFGVSSDEYLQYAVNNRREWERKGQQIVADMVEQESKNEQTQTEMPHPRTNDNRGGEGLCNGAQEEGHPSLTVVKQGAAYPVI